MKDFRGYEVIETGVDAGRYATPEVAAEAYVDDCCSWISDASKDVQGFRNRIDPTDMTFAALEAACEYWSNAANEAVKEEREIAEAAVVEFKQAVRDIIDIGAGDLATAIRWMTQSTKFYHQQDVEHWVYNHGILFTSFGKALVRRLENIVEYEEWDVA